MTGQTAEEELISGINSIVFYWLAGAKIDTSLSRRIIGLLRQAGFKSPEEVAAAIEASNNKMMANLFGRYFTSFEEMAEAKGYKSPEEVEELQADLTEKFAIKFEKRIKGAKRNEKMNRMKR